jgi:hypothetical protein
MRPLFQATRFGHTTGKFVICIIDPPIHRIPPHRQPDVDSLKYCETLNEPQTVKIPSLRFSALQGMAFTLLSLNIEG